MFVVTDCKAPRVKLTVILIITDQQVESETTYKNDPSDDDKVNFCLYSKYAASHTSRKYGKTDN